MKKMKLLSMLLALVMLIGAAACGGSGASTGGNTPGASQPAPGPASPSSPSSPAPAGTPATAGAEQVLRYAIINDPDGIDPGITQNTFAAPFLHTMFQGLVTYDLNNELIPGLAKEWTISDDATVYTFTLRDGLKWSDGSPLTAEDFVYSWQRVMDPEVGSAAAQQMYLYIKNGKKVYDGELPKDQVGLKAIDDVTLEVTLEAPTPFILQLMASWTYYPVCKAVVEKNPDWTRNADTYVSSGAFKFGEYRLSDTFTVLKNEYFWDADNVSLERIEFKFIPELATALAAYERGEVDGLLRVPATEVPNLRSRDDFYSLPQFGNTYYLVNITEPGLTDVRVREALALAVDRTSIIEDVIMSPCDPVRGHVPKGYVVDGKDFREEGGYYGLSETADIEKARRLLAEAGYPNGEGFPNVRLGYYTNERAKRVAEALQQMYKQNLNIDFEIVSAEWTVFYDQVMDLDYGICAMGDLGTYLHPMAFLSTFAGDTPPLETGWRSAEYDDLIAQISASSDEKQAIGLMHQAEDIFMRDWPIIPIFSANQDMMMATYVQDWNYTPTGSFVFNNIKIAEH